jgi:DNA invertase Pin-like site-specific DNA recombinase
MGGLGGGTDGDEGVARGRLLGYARVSTEEQTLALQLDALGQAGCTRIFRDVGVSGAARQRPGLERCLAELKPGDVLVVWKFDRAFRSLKHALDTLEDFEARGIDFRELAHNIDTTTAMGRAFFHIRGAFAELERGLAVERTVAGMNAARRRGVRIGRPPLLEAGEIAAMHRRIGGGEITLRAAAARLGVHPDTLKRGFRREGLAGALQAGGGDG